MVCKTGMLPPFLRECSRSDFGAQGGVRGVFHLMVRSEKCINRECLQSWLGKGSCRLSPRRRCILRVAWRSASLRSPPPCSCLRPMVRHPAHHLEVCILAPTVAGDPRRRHPNVVTRTICNPPKTEGLHRNVKREAGSLIEPCNRGLSPRHGAGESRTR